MKLRPFPRLSLSFSKGFIASLKKSSTIRLVRTTEEQDTDNLDFKANQTHPILDMFSLVVDNVEEKTSEVVAIEDALTALTVPTFERWVLNVEKQLGEHGEEDGLPAATYSEAQINPRVSPPFLLERFDR